MERVKEEREAGEGKNWEVKKRNKEERKVYEGEIK